MLVLIETNPTTKRGTTLHATKNPPRTTVKDPIMDMVTKSRELSSICTLKVNSFLYHNDNCVLFDSSKHHAFSCKPGNFCHSFSAARCSLFLLPSWSQFLAT